MLIEQMEGKRVEVKLKGYEDGHTTFTTTEAKFLKFGDSFEEFENGAMQITVAIVILDDGQIRTADPDSVKILK